MPTLSTLGERALIRLLTSGLPMPRSVCVGPGDDAAVVRAARGRDLVLKCDAVVEGVHFHPEASPRAAGRKAVGRVLSDFAAMGAEPRHLLVSLAAPDSTPVARIRDLYRGLRTIAEAHGVTLVGGETVRANQLALHVFGIGELPAGRALLRSGARAGDILFVTGELGGSFTGRHLRFDPRVREGRWLLAGGWSRAAIDISDGLATDLRHLVTASGVGADLDPLRIPVSAAARRSRDGRTPLEHALEDGEDFELLFTVPRRKVPAFLKAWPRAFATRVTAFGAITPHVGRIRLRTPGAPDRELQARGYEHFQSARAAT
ncbi:MAG TPA: thiamine-phosphate kinase [Kiritimatiellia bacterium]|nr:thiamine-phosphate kinase [Kiritimatiellia bacterium]